MHRGFPTPPDVSADLGACARSPPSSRPPGVKSLLDVPATAELLETLGIPVLGYRVDTLPLFYAADGGPPVSARVETPARRRASRTRTGRSAARRCSSAARRTRASTSTDLIEEIVAEADAAGIVGQAVTPYVLATLHERSGGETRRVNRDLIVANAGLAAEIAVAYAAL